MYAILENLTWWLVTLRAMEVKTGSSIVADLKRDVDAYEQALSETEAVLGVSK